MGGEFFFGGGGGGVGKRRGGGCGSGKGSLMRRLEMERSIFRL